MSNDPIADAAQQQAQQEGGAAAQGESTSAISQSSSTEVNVVTDAALPPVSNAVAETDATNATANAATPIATAETDASTVQASASSDAPSSESNRGSAGDTTEHPHTSILRRMTETLRRKWNVFDGELEAILKDAESHL